MKHPRVASRHPLKGAHLRTGKAGSWVLLDEGQFAPESLEGTPRAASYHLLT
jgi:hypothetical protein